ncbi:hypothetical protein [Komagataeibacter europaeus]|uniref:hypothetical protein n=1 Tax=Komagataeibacter europaeus TaxID=33995 RepID=UPI0012DE0482|nr:hypothetical protein [Komagataeibacter europaeus]
MVGIIYKTHKENWNSHLKNSDEIVFINPPFSPLTGELYLTPGIYNYGNIPDSVPNYWLMDGMLEYFKKDSLTVMNYKK